MVSLMMVHLLPCLCIHDSLPQAMPNKHRISLQWPGCSIHRPGPQISTNMDPPDNLARIAFIYIWCWDNVPIGNIGQAENGTNCVACSFLLISAPADLSRVVGSWFGPLQQEYLGFAAHIDTHRLSWTLFFLFDLSTIEIVTLKYA